MKKNPDKKSIQDWESRYGRPLSEADYRQICDGLDGFFTLLKKWESSNHSQNQKGEDNANANE